MSRQEQLVLPPVRILGLNDQFGGSCGGVMQHLRVAGDDATTGLRVGDKVRTVAW